jgi:hypothetical protein
MVAFVVAHRPHDRVPIGQPSHPRHVFADLDPGHVSLNGPEGPPNRFGRLGLQVPHVELRGSPREEQDDNRPSPGCPLEPVFAGHGLAQLQEAGKGQTAESKRPDAKDLAPRQAVTMVDAIRQGKREHGRDPDFGTLRIG